MLDYLNGREHAIAALDRELESLAISVITYGEVYEGILAGENTQQQAEAFEDFLDGPALLLVDQRVAHTWARLRGALRTGGHPLPDADLLIAATAITHDAMLITGNRKHFERIPGLQLFDP